MYQINLDKKAKNFLKKLQKNESNKITQKLEELKQNPFLGKPLTANLSGHFRLRIGKYRAIYRIFQNKLIILVLNIGHRKNIY